MADNHEESESFFAAHTISFVRDKNQKPPKKFLKISAQRKTTKISAQGICTKISAPILSLEKEESAVLLVSTNITAEYIQTFSW